MIIYADEAARQLNVHHTLVCRWCKNGRLKATKTRAGWEILQSDLDEFASKPRPTGRPPKQDGNANVNKR